MRQASWGGDKSLTFQSSIYEYGCLLSKQVQVWNMDSWYNLIEPSQQVASGTLGVIGRNESDR